METEVTSNYIRVTQGLIEAMHVSTLSNLGNILLLKLAPPTDIETIIMGHVQYTDEMHSLSYIRSILGTYIRDKRMFCTCYLHKN